MAIIFWFLGTLEVRKMIGVWMVRHIKCSFPTCESTRWSVKVFKVSSEDSTSENLSSQRVSLPGSGLWGFELSGQVLECVLSFWSATGILPCFFRSPSHCSQEPHLPWAAASDTGDHWTSRHPACTSESGKKEMVWNNLMNLIRHNGLRGFEWKDFRAFTAWFSSLRKLWEQEDDKNVQKG